jgi:hypothetical protein
MSTLVAWIAASVESELVRALAGLILLAGVVILIGLLFAPALLSLIAPWWPGVVATAVLGGVGLLVYLRA